MMAHVWIEPFWVVEKKPIEKMKWNVRFFAAKCRGVLPFSSFTFGSAPAPNSTLTTARLALIVAKGKRVKSSVVNKNQPLIHTRVVRAFGSAPSSRQLCTVAGVAASKKRFRVPVPTIHRDGNSYRRGKGKDDEARGNDFGKGGKSTHGVDPVVFFEGSLRRGRMLRRFSGGREGRDTMLFPLAPARSRLAAVARCGQPPPSAR